MKIILKHEIGFNKSNIHLVKKCFIKEKIKFCVFCLFRVFRLIFFEQKIC